MNDESAARESGDRTDGLRPKLSIIVIGAVAIGLIVLMCIAVGLIAYLQST